MKYYAKGMDIDYVQSQYPHVRKKYIVQAMLHIRRYGYPKEENIIIWFNYVLMCYILEYRFDLDGIPIL